MKNKPITNESMDRFIRYYKGDNLSELDALSDIGSFLAESSSPDKHLFYELIANTLFEKAKKLIKKKTKGYELIPLGQSKDLRDTMNYVTSGVGLVFVSPDTWR
jgi:hypothetical protein